MMNHDPLRRRYGYGAARVALGGATAGPSLAQVARRSISRETRFALLPGLVCLAVSMLLFWASSPASPPSLMADDSPLRIRMLEQTTPPIVSVPSESVSPSVAQPVAPPAAETTNEPVQIAEEPTPDPMAIVSLALTSVAVPSESTPIEPVAPALPRSARPEPGRSRTPMPALALNAIDRPADFTGDTPTPFASAQAQAASRPRATADDGAPDDALALPGAAESRRKFLAELNADPGPVATRRGRSAPPVAAAQASAALTDSIHADLDELSNALRGAGWEEIPLGALPECSPPGRQDALKERILLAAPFQRECSHQDGSYRFVETRNLNAFLMWAHPNPDRPLARRTERDVCDVLEAALRCLAGRSTKEPALR